MGDEEMRELCEMVRGATLGTSDRSTTIAANALAPRLGASFQRVIEDAIAIDAETGQMKAVAKYFCKFSQATISEEFLTNPDFLEVLISGLDDPPHLIEEWTPVLQH